jgi:hypothetical protein
MATFSEAVTLPMRKCCTKCGQEKPLTSFYRNKKASDGSPESVSLDRVDSGKGYIQGNVVLCCVYANRMKNDQSVDEFVRWCKLIVDHHKDKNIND